MKFIASCHESIVFDHEKSYNTKKHNSISNYTQKRTNSYFSSQRRFGQDFVSKFSNTKENKHTPIDNVSQDNFSFLLLLKILKILLFTRVENAEC